MSFTVRPATSIDSRAVGLAVTSTLEGVGGRGIGIDTQTVEAIRRTGLGKAPRIRSERPLTPAEGL